MYKEVQIFDEQGCPKIQEFLESDTKLWVCLSYPLWHKNRLHSAERKAKMFAD